MMKSVLLVCVIIGASSAASLPPYIKKCSKGADLDKCAIASANAAISKFAKGDDKYKIPSTDPIFVKELSVQEKGSSLNVNIKFNNMLIKGLADSKLVGSRIDLDKKVIDWTLEVPKIAIQSKYKVDGRILVLPLTGDGDCYIEMNRLKLKFTLTYKVITFKGREVMKIEKINAKHFTEKLKLRLENLFNGDKILGENMNNILNDNWEELNTQLGPPLVDSIGLFVQANLNRFLSQVPYSDIFDI